MDREGGVRPTGEDRVARDRLVGGVHGDLHVDRGTT